MINAPIVTVLIPAFNAECHLSEALRSACNQTVKELEILVIDDGSGDGTAALVRQWIEKDARIRLLEKANGGVSSARNLGLSEARGTYIAFLDADDIWAPDKLEAQLACFATGDVGLVHTGVADIDDEGRPCPAQEPWGNGEGRVFGRLLQANFICCSSVMVEADRVKPPHRGFVLGRLCEDWLLWSELALTCRFGFVDRPLVQYRVHPGGTSRNRGRMLRAEIACRRDLLHLARTLGTPAERKQGRAGLFRACCHAAKFAARQGERAEALGLCWQALRAMPPSLEAFVRLASVFIRCVTGPRHNSRPL